MIHPRGGKQNPRVIRPLLQRPGVIPACQFRFFSEQMDVTHIHQRRRVFLAYEYFIKLAYRAVEQAVRRRLRPILMSTLTSLFGMLPLLLIPGPGTEVYQGLAAVIVGGMSVSTIFTLVFLPSLLRLGETAVAVAEGLWCDVACLGASFPASVAARAWAKRTDGINALGLRARAIQADSGPGALAAAIGAASAGARATAT